MAGGNVERRERLTKLEALIGNVPEGDEIETLMTRLANLEAELARLSQENEDLKCETVVLRRAVGEDVPQRGADRLHVKIPEPKAFGGARSARELENFLWDMEQYFHVIRVKDEKEKVTLTSMYLSEDAKLWWRTRVAEDESLGRPKIESWERLRKELKDQFLPNNTSWITRDKLKRLKHTGSVRAYVKEFISLMLSISNMSEEDKLHNFMSGLQQWAQLELRRQNIQNLASAVTAADALDDFHLGEDSSTSKSNDGKKDKAREGKESENSNANEDKGKGKQEAGTSKSKEKGRFSGCFLCDGTHRARDCPKKAVLNAMTAADMRAA
ncbi:uncharacterized protein [Nicotiana tomentosiformis]|uniref:uncharacterized protein n=1 Tax=Nicotiana tomentosiformis TaxID=4098 RepID=UPI00144599D9|nr:uncharacterized protein LOC117277317 [Nicotiana tomentosiformis]